MVVCEELCVKVSERVVCERLFVTKLCVKELCMTKLFVTKLCVKDCVCDKVVCVCVKDCVWQSCVWKIVCDKVVRSCVWKSCVCGKPWIKGCKQGGNSPSSYVSQRSYGRCGGRAHGRMNLYLLFVCDPEWDPANPRTGSPFAVCHIMACVF